MGKSGKDKDTWEHRQAKIHPSLEITREDIAQKMLRVSALTKDKSLLEYAQRLSGCGKKYHVHKCDSCTNVEVKGSRCESRICPECGKKRMNKLIAQNSDFLFRLPTNPKGNKRTTLLTLTFKNIPYEDWDSSDYDYATKCMSQFYNHPKIKPKMRGGIYAIETKRPPEGYVYRTGHHLDNKDREVNIHIHALVDADYMHSQMVSNVWREITGDSYIVNLKSVKASIPALKETLKYALEAPNMGDVDSYIKFIEYTKGKRLYNTFGTFRKRFQLSKKGRNQCNICKEGKLIFVTECGRKEALAWRELKKGPPVDIYGNVSSVGVPSLIGMFPEYGTYFDKTMEREKFGKA